MPWANPQCNLWSANSPRLGIRRCQDLVQGLVLALGEQVCQGLAILVCRALDQLWTLLWVNEKNKAWYHTLLCLGVISVQSWVSKFAKA